jgi:hypothetical protein
MGEIMRKLLCSMALVGMLAAPVAVQAQLEAGPYLAYNNDLGGGTVGVGGYIAIPVPQLAAGFAIVPDLGIYFPDGGSFFEINGDLAYFFPVAEGSPVLPFAFGGLNWARFSPDGGSASSDIGLNLGGGVQFPGTVRPFAGAKFAIQDNTAFVIFGGIGFALGG